MAGYAALPTKNPGDLLTSALWNTYLQGNADSGFMRMIGDTTLGGSVASIVFSSIPSTFAHLLVVCSLLSDQAADQQLWMRLNGDTSAHYRWQIVFGQGAVANATSDGGSLVAQAVIGFAGANASAGKSHAAALISDYASVVRHAFDASFFSIGSSIQGGSGGGFINQAAAINSVTLLPAAGNFVAGGRATLYGLPH